MSKDPPHSLLFLLLSFPALWRHIPQLTTHNSDVKISHFLITASSQCPPSSLLCTVTQLVSSFSPSLALSLCTISPFKSPRSFQATPRFNFPTQFETAFVLLSESFILHIVSTFSLHLCLIFSSSSHLLQAFCTSQKKSGLHLNSHVWPFASPVCLHPASVCFLKPPSHFVLSCCQLCSKQHLFLISFISTLSTLSNQ